MKKNKYIPLSLLLFFILGCSTVEQVSKKKSEALNLESMSIKEMVAKYYSSNLIVGTSNAEKLLGELSTEIADREFAYITPTNDFKQSYIHPTPQRWRWEKPDRYLNYARKKGQKIRMHGPISPQCSKWIKEDKRTPKELSKMLDEYMIALSMRYNKASEIIQWMDVVNETICPENVSGFGQNFKNRKPGDWFGPRKGTDKWENPWLAIGIDEKSPLGVPYYIDRAFELANQYAPCIKQIINQHGQFEAVVWAKMRKLVRYLRNEKGRRVDGLGWQAHITTGWEKEPGNLQRLDEVIKWCHANHLEFHITEMNVWMKNKQMTEIMQAETFAAITRVLLNNVETGVVGLSFWTVREEDSANEQWKGTLWRNDGSARPAYYSIKKELIKRIK